MLRVSYAKAKGLFKVYVFNRRRDRGCLLEHTNGAFFHVYLRYSIAGVSLERYLREPLLGIYIKRETIGAGGKVGDVEPLVGVVIEVGVAPAHRDALKFFVADPIHGLFGAARELHLYATYVAEAKG